MKKKNTRPTKKLIKRMEQTYSEHFINWQAGDTLVTYFRRNGMTGLADEWEKDYKRLGLL